MNYKTQEVIIEPEESLELASEDEVSTLNELLIEAPELRDTINNRLCEKGLSYYAEMSSKDIQAAIDWINFKIKQKEQVL